MLDLTQRLAAHLLETGADASAQQAARDVMRYFDLAAPAHHEDEERHVLPQLREQGQAALADRLHADHALMSTTWATVRADLAAGGRRHLARCRPRRGGRALAGHGIVVSRPHRSRGVLGLSRREGCDRRRHAARDGRRNGAPTRPAGRRLKPLLSRPRGRGGAARRHDCGRYAASGRLRCGHGAPESRCGARRTQLQELISCHPERFSSPRAAAPPRSSTSRWWAWCWRRGATTTCAWSTARATACAASSTRTSST